MDTQPDDDEPKLLTKDQVVELALYVASGAVVGGAFSSRWGVWGVILGLVIVGAALFGIFLSLTVLVNFLRRYFWRRRHRRSVIEATD